MFRIRLCGGCQQDLVGDRLDRIRMLSIIWSAVEYLRPIMNEDQCINLNYRAVNVILTNSRHSQNN
jgi:hypothetical protein